MLTNQIIRSPAMAKATVASDDGGRSRESQARVWVAKEFGGTGLGWGRLSTETSQYPVPVI